MNDLTPKEVETTPEEQTPEPTFKPTCPYQVQEEDDE